MVELSATAGTTTTDPSAAVWMSRLSYPSAPASITPLRLPAGPKMKASSLAELPVRFSIPANPTSRSPDAVSLSSPPPASVICQMVSLSGPINPSSPAPPPSMPSRRPPAISVKMSPSPPPVRFSMSLNSTRLFSIPALEPVICQSLIVSGPASLSLPVAPETRNDALKSGSNVFKVRVSLPALRSIARDAAGLSKARPAVEVPSLSRKS